MSEVLRMDDWARKLYSGFHHYVPKFYLKRFADKRDQIRVYDCQERKFFSANISRVAGERALNSIKEMHFDEENTRVFVEQMFSELESKYAAHTNAVFALIRDEINIVDEARYTLAHMMYTQMHRTPRFRKTYIEIMQKSWLDYVKQEHGSESDLNDLVPEPRDFAFHLAKLLIDPQAGNLDFCDRLISDYYWIVLVNNSSVPFLTSDNPVMLHVPREKIETVYYPLSPKICIQLLNKSIYPEFSDRDGMHHHSTKTDAATTINRNIFLTANRYVFGIPPNTFVETLVT